MMVRSFKLNVPDVVVAVLMLMLMAMANNEVAVNADVFTVPVGAGDHGLDGGELHDERGKCENDPDFLYKGEPGKDCDSWVPLKGGNCRKNQNDLDGNQTGKKVKFYCPQQCKSQCATGDDDDDDDDDKPRGKCENDPDFLFKGEPGKDCDSWVPLKGGNCRKNQKDSDGNRTGKTVKFYCPQQCKSKCVSIENNPGVTGNLLAYKCPKDFPKPNGKKGDPNGWTWCWPYQGDHPGGDKHHCWATAHSKLCPKGYYVHDRCNIPKPHNGDAASPSKITTLEQPQQDYDPGGGSWTIPLCYKP